MSDPQAGWYPDPTEPGKMRWWDGAAWGEQRDSVVTPSSPPPMPPAPPTFGVGTVPMGPGPASAYGPGPAYSTGGRGGETNKLALWSMISSLAFGFLCGIGYVVGIVLGIVALNQFKRPGNTQTGKGFAVAGIAVGAVCLLAIILFLLTGHITMCSHTSGAGCPTVT